MIPSSHTCAQCDPYYTASVYILSGGASAGQHRPLLLLRLDLAIAAVWFLVRTVEARAVLALLHLAVLRTEWKTLVVKKLSGRRLRLAVALAVRRAVRR